jgi:hypothetical protein
MAEGAEKTFTLKQGTQRRRTKRPMTPLAHLATDEDSVPGFPL